MGTHLPHGNGKQPPLFGPLLSPASPQARILPITRIVESTRQCAADDYRGNPTGIATRLVVLMHLERFWATVCKTVRPMPSDHSLSYLCRWCIVAKRFDGLGYATWYGGRSRPRPHCVTCRPRSPKGGRATPNFWSMSVVAKRSPISATAVLLLHLCRVLLVRFGHHLTCMLTRSNVGYYQLY